MRVRGKGARQHGDRIVAAIAVPRVLDAFGADQDVDAGSVERRAEGVGMQCLTPLVVGLFVAMATVLGLRKSAGLNEVVTFDSSISGQGQVVFAEKKVVGLPYFVGVALRFGVFARLGVGGEPRNSREPGDNQETGGAQKNPACSRLHRYPPAPSGIAHPGLTVNGLPSPGNIRKVRKPTAERLRLRLFEFARLSPFSRGFFLLALAFQCVG